MRTKTFADMKTPRATNHKGYIVWMVDEKPLLFEENVYLERSDDFVALAASEELGWLDTIIGRIVDVVVPRNVSHGRMVYLTDYPPVLLTLAVEYFHDS